MRNALLIISIVVFMFTSCSDNENICNEPTDLRWWILVHPSYGNSGIYLYNETKSIIERVIELPKEASSPHALDYDGVNLWLGGMGEDQCIYQINPENGSVNSKISNIRTEGIAIHDNYIYYSTFGYIVKITFDGSKIEEIPLASKIVPSDIEFDNTSLYYVYNDELDPIIRINENNAGEDIIAYTDIKGLYSLSIHRNQFVAVNDDNFLRRFDINSGQKMSDVRINIEGWITAITPYNY